LEGQGAHAECLGSRQLVMHEYSRNPVALPGQGAFLPALKYGVSCAIF
jgi:hypothetical protein